MSLDPRDPFVRVKDTVTGHEYSVSESSVDPDRHTVLKDRPAADASGDPLPAKPNVAIADAASHRASKRPAPSQSTTATDIPSAETKE